MKILRRRDMYRLYFITKMMNSILNFQCANFHWQSFIYLCIYIHDLQLSWIEYLCHDRGSSDFFLTKCNLT